MFARRLISIVGHAKPIHRVSTIRAFSAKSGDNVGKNVTANSTATGQGRGANNHGAGIGTGINANENPQAQRTAHSTINHSGANTGDMPATSTTGMKSTSGSSQGNYAKQADKTASKSDPLTAASSPKKSKVETKRPATPNAASGDQTLGGGAGEIVGGDTGQKGTGKGSADSPEGVTIQEATDLKRPQKPSSATSAPRSSTSSGSSSKSVNTSNDQTVGSGGAIGSQGSNQAGGGSLKTNTGEATAGAGTGLGTGSGLTANLKEKAADLKEKVADITGNKELPEANSWQVLLAVAIGVPILLAIDPDARFLTKQQKDAEMRAAKH